MLEPELQPLDPETSWRKLLHDASLLLRHSLRETEETFVPDAGVLRTPNQITKISLITKKSA